ncbi:complement factor H-like isoform X3 [Brachyhypopomus gauderio]|uniref:complement factor H-like isoform X3 n=1 Tax=Brachyhypopomus gauderio TaxID=698409 RepID=UPI004041D18E
MLQSSTQLRSRMQMAIKNFMVALLVCSFTLTQSKECQQSQITYENIKRSDLKQQYNEGEIIRVTCATGYVGFHKIACFDGTWTSISERECKKKPCGHPGDTANGDFKLIGDNEFVFGVTVEYSCRTGYIMASRERRRNCRAQGWDNAIPVCEVVKCPAIKTSEGVIAMGNIDEASFDDVIHFECTSPRKMLDGAKNIHCTKDGTWSEPVPNCIEITCVPPDIAFVDIINKKIYKEDELLQYTCLNGYKQSGNSKCGKNGWSMKPECEEITCVLGFISGLKSTSPSGKNIFKPKERLTVTCEDKHWFGGTKQTSVTIQCNDNGEWGTSIICNEMTCDVPKDEYLYSPYVYFSGDKRLGVTKEYHCTDGYEHTASYATCKVNGWSPQPLCTKIKCPKPVIENAMILTTQVTYEAGDRIRMQCLPGYEPESFVITCSRYNKQWQNKQKCTIAEGACGRIILINGFINNIRGNDGSQYASYSCDKGYKPFHEELWKTVICQNGIWNSMPQCIRKDECGSLPSVEHGKQIQINEAHQHGQSLKFECDFGYKSRPSSITCLNGQWDKPVCEEQRQGCVQPLTVPFKSLKAHYEEGENITYTCSMTPDTLLTCIQGEWIGNVTCNRSCIIKDEDLIEHNIKIISSLHPKNHAEHSIKIQFQCLKNKYRIGNTSLKQECQNGKISLPTCA